MKSCHVGSEVCGAALLRRRFLLNYMFERLASNEFESRKYTMMMI